MKKKDEKRIRISPEEAIRFLDDIQMMQSDLDEPTAAISLRVPQNLLRALKTQAKLSGKKYQSLMIELIRKQMKLNQ